MPYALPTAQLVQDAAPEAVAYFPAAQLVQSAASCEPVVAKYLPLAQVVHAMLAVVVIKYWPAAQSVQVD